MVLSAAVQSFAQELEINDKTPSATSGEAASKFARAFANFFGSATLTGVPIQAGTNLSPGAIQAMIGPLTTAFTAPSTPADSSLLIQAAIIAYINAGPVTAMWPGVAQSIAPVAPDLGSIIATSMVPILPSPKVKLANGIMTWVTSGIEVTLTPSGTAKFI